MIFPRFRGHLVTQLLPSLHTRPGNDSRGLSADASDCKHLDVFEDVLLGFVLCGIVPMVHEFSLERPEEAFDAGIVPAISFAAHARRDEVRGQHLLIWPCGILTPAIGVMQEPSVGLPGRECHTECLLG
jgi:hypothetical protein